MNFTFTTILAQNEAPAAPEGQSSPAGSMFGHPMIMIGAMVILFYVLIIRPQSKQRKEHQARMEAVKKGDKVVTNAGIHGTVMYVDANTINLQVAEGVTIKLEKAAIAHVQKKEAA